MSDPRRSDDARDPQPVRLADYAPPAFTTVQTDLTFEIEPGATRVTANLTLERQRDGDEVRLDGQELELISVAVDGRALSGNEYRVDDDSLTLFGLSDRANVEIVTRITPETNTSLEGLYKSKTMYCSQCEAEGFRKITYYQDRPDVLSRFRTTIVADGDAYPNLLSNGNLVSSSVTEDGRAKVVWEDPHPKPSYLFALVAGNLASIEDSFVTASGREVTLRIFSEPHNIGQCDYSMDVLKRSMRWDEEVFGREYDLDVFMIVAVEDFNMGAMENKGLNIFNTTCVLASADTATDQAYQRVEGVVAHEYFHNWSGNRVTCRDWFQLSLKEGFTVFRDAEFSSDMNSRTVKRIEDVAFLRAIQFAEDAGPLAHPVRPDSYIEISNFYTPTVYEKGAEVVRMLHTLLGPDGFRRGSDLYFDRHDGQAVTTDDFVRAMEDANGIDLRQFRSWYSQAGTPVLDVDVDQTGDALVLNVEQTCPATPGQEVKAPFHVPLKLGLVDDRGDDVVLNELTIDTDDGVAIDVHDTDAVVHLTGRHTRISFRGLPGHARPSLLRGFSAPVRLARETSDADLEFLAQNDSDGFCQWDAQRTRLVREVGALMAGADVSDGVLAMMDGILERAVALTDDPERKLLFEQLLALPTETYLLEQFDVVDVDALCTALDRLRVAVARRSEDRWRTLFDANGSGPFEPTSRQMGERGLKNVALRFLDAAMVRDVRSLLDAQYTAADNLTDRRAVLAIAAESEAYDDAERNALFKAFYERWQDEALVVDVWFSVQAQARAPGGLARIEALEAHDAFDALNPNKVRSLYGAFAQSNFPNFHAADGAGYEFLGERVRRLDRSNPQLASRLCNPLTRWRKFDAGRQRLMKSALADIGAQTGLSKDVFEVVEKGLA